MRSIKIFKLLTKYFEQKNNFFYFLLGFIFKIFKTIIILIKLLKNYPYRYINIIIFGIL